MFWELAINRTGRRSTGTGGVRHENISDPHHPCSPGKLNIEPLLQHSACFSATKHHSLALKVSENLLQSKIELN